MSLEAEGDGNHRGLGIGIVRGGEGRKRSPDEPRVRDADEVRSVFRTESVTGSFHGRKRVGARGGWAHSPWSV